MGLFDYVDFPPIDCPFCGTEIKEWQSKDGECTMSKISPVEVSAFYALCLKCYSWIGFRRKREEQKDLDVREYVHEHFEMEIRRYEP